MKSVNFLSAIGGSFVPEYAPITPQLLFFNFLKDKKERNELTNES